MLPRGLPFGPGHPKFRNSKPGSEGSKLEIRRRNQPNQPEWVSKMLRIDFVRPPNRMFSSGSLGENRLLRALKSQIFLRLAPLAERTDTSSKIVSKADRPPLMPDQLHGRRDGPTERVSVRAVVARRTCLTRTRGRRVLVEAHSFINMLGILV